MRRLAFALAMALSLAGCAHAAGPLANRKHASLTLLPISGVVADQAAVLEDAICQGLVDGNGGDVSCPSSVRQVLALQRQRALATGDVTAADQVVEQSMLMGENVQAQVAHEGEDWALTLSYAEAPDTPAKATQKISARSFEELVERATEAAHALLR